MGKTVSLPLGQIRADERLQMRVCVDQEAVNEYADAMLAGGEFPPLVVYYDGETYWLADGFHRLLAAWKLKRKKIACEVREGGFEAALLYACGANQTIPRTDADRRKAVATVLDHPEWSRKSQNEIARICSVSRCLVQTMLKERQGIQPVAGIRGKRRDATPAEAIPQEQDRPEREPGARTESCLKADPAPQEEPAEDPPETCLEAPSDTQDEGIETRRQGRLKAPSASALPAVDEVGIPLEDEALVERFRALSQGKDARSLARKLGQMLSGICAGPGGEHLRQELRAKHKPGTHDEIVYKSHLVEQILRQLRQHLPHAAACPWCHVTGEGQCKACKGLGYVTRQLWDQAPDDYREKTRRDLATHSVEVKDVDEDEGEERAAA